MDWLKDKQCMYPDLVLKTILLHNPGHLYWQDTKGTMLVCNAAQAIALEFNRPEEVIRPLA